MDIVSNGLRMNIDSEGLRMDIVSEVLRIDFVLRYRNTDLTIDMLQIRTYIIFLAYMMIDELQ